MEKVKNDYDNIIVGENIKNGEINLFLITVLFISIATKLYKSQWSWFIPEYNMLPEDKKKNITKINFVGHIHIV